MSNRDCITLAEKIRAAIVYKKPFTMPLLRASEFKQVFEYLEDIL